MIDLKGGPSLPRSILKHREVPKSDQDYLVGLRGLFVLETFIWIFLQTFVPATVKGSTNTPDRPYQKALREGFSVLFWNDALIYSFFILLSARTVCIPFLRDPTRTILASAVFRRGLRLWIPVAVSLACAKIISSASGWGYVDDFKKLTANTSFHTPYALPTTLAYFNSVFNLFWTNRHWSQQAGSTAFPSQTMWIINVIYMQSYTIYMTMVIIPYTRNAWRVKAYVFFIFTAWWVQSWAWYSITGLFLADAVINMRFKERCQAGIQVYRSIRCPAWVPFVLMMAVGLMMQYLWTDFRPQYANGELISHAGRHDPGGSNDWPSSNEPQGRIDIYFVLLGLFLILDSSESLQKIFENRVFQYLGQRSLAWFLVQALMMYTAGIKLSSHLLRSKAMSLEGSNAVCFIVCLALTAFAGEVFYRVVDHPWQRFSLRAFDWIRE